MTTVQPARQVPFRAGHMTGEPARGLAAHPAFTLPGVVLMADISEFQPDITDAVYAAWSKAVIIRAAYGDAHDDRAWYGGARRDQLHAAGIRFLGIYQYIVAGQDITAQAQAFCRLIGAPRPGEYYIADIEEGPGNLQATWQAWANVVHSTLGVAPGDYSGLNFAAAHGLAPVNWVAAYGTAEPAALHLFWQFTDAMTIPGIPGTCDCSVFHGSIDQLAALGYAGQPVTPPVNWQDQLMNALPVVQQGATGEDARTVQGLCCARHHTVTVDGVFGPLTAAAVRAVQSAAHITADGIVGPLTWAALAGV